LVGALTEIGVDIVHIHADGNLETYDEALLRLLKILGLPEMDLFRSTAEIIEEACALQERRIAYVDEDKAHEVVEAYP